jgi:hypothetical protein
MGREGMYFPVHNVPETFVDIGNFIGNYYYYIGNYYHYDCDYIPEFLYIHEFRIVENGPVWS